MFAELTNLAKCITAELENDVAKHKEDLKKQNVAAVKLFVDAIYGVENWAENAFTTRGAVGRIQQRKIKAALEHIEHHMSDVITIKPHFGYEVVGLDVSEPQKPKLQVHSLSNTDSIPYLTCPSRYQGEGYRHQCHQID